ncbi:RdgB/HAM1 family non-canonical purine NTP pyrophosphatase [Acidithrix sp. C25]|uniref:RdgB/HAM1 family non-canonical purine NTP pyrophosphatase n=1 Tax=Acidithrix sp. C25 TaxID=1671482 RepID=UPI000B1C1DA8|nr:RdgB/HAM1 family non-canonical purine NTP pyrophosphatase [Acidithrix sp. C25]CAG4927945.1 unnamed protein product [Acidithrix sp. C25]
MIDRIILASGNQGKQREISEILSPLGIFVETIDGALEMPEETGTTLSENAIIKARFGKEVSGLPSLGDDSGLFVEALNGEPGIFSARYSGEFANDETNRMKLLGELASMGIDRSPAYFMCAMALVGVDSIDEPIVCLGKVEGYVTNFVKGHDGFGYDPIFIPSEGDGRTFAEMAHLEKNAISHRGRALSELYGVISKLNSI